MTQEGLEELKSQLVMVAKDTAPRNQRAPFRLWIDRIVTVKGHGMVVTGSVLSGTAKVDDHLLLISIWVKRCEFAVWNAMEIKWKRLLLGSGQH